MDHATTALGLLAAILHGYAYYLYNVQVKTGASRPNITTWGIGAFLSTLNALTFQAMSGDKIATMQFYMGTVASIITFLFALSLGKFTWPKKPEWLIIGLALASCFVWWRYKSATGANMILLMTFMLIFIPTLAGVIKDPLKETAKPWLLWTIAYCVTSVNIILRDAAPIALLPTLLLASAHGSIAGLSSENRKKLFSGR